MITALATQAIIAIRARRDPYTATASIGISSSGPMPASRPSVPARTRSHRRAPRNGARAARGPDSPGQAHAGKGECPAAQVEPPLDVLRGNQGRNAKQIAGDRGEGDSVANLIATVIPEVPVAAMGRCIPNGWILRLSYLTVLPFFTHSGHSTGGRTYHSVLKASCTPIISGAWRLKTVQKKFSKEIRNLREELSARLDAIEARRSRSFSESSSGFPDSAAPGPSSRNTGEQLRHSGSGTCGQRQLRVAGPVERCGDRPAASRSEAARVVEDALANTEGVNEASARTSRRLSHHRHQG